MTNPVTPADILREEMALIDAGFAVQRQNLDILLAEMRALSALMPGRQTDQTPAEIEAEVEAGFDNMPI